MFEDEIIGTTDTYSPDILTRMRLGKQFEAEENAWNSFTAVLDASSPSLAKNHFQSIEHDRMMEALGIANPNLKKSAPEVWFDPQILPFLQAFKKAGGTHDTLEELGKSLRKSGKSCLPSEAMQSLMEKYESKLSVEVKDLMQRAIKAMDITLFMDLIREFVPSQV